MRERLLQALRSVGNCCYPPVEEALWPSEGLLDQLDSAVMALAMMKRKKLITVHAPYWKAYERVDKRRPEIKLIPRVKDLIGRADKLLRAAGESELVRLRRKASEGVPEARRLRRPRARQARLSGRIMRASWGATSPFDSRTAIRLPVA